MTTKAAVAEARSTLRRAHHEGGHSVAAVARGGELSNVHLGKADWTNPDDSGGEPGETCHESAQKDRPFVTFAGPWAEAKWTVEHLEPDLDFDEAFDNAQAENHSETAKYDSWVEGFAAPPQKSDSRSPVIPGRQTGPWNWECSGPPSVRSLRC